MDATKMLLRAFIANFFREVSVRYQRRRPMENSCCNKIGDTAEARSGAEKIFLHGEMINSRRRYGSEKEAYIRAANGTRRDLGTGHGLG